jgi:ribosomal protein S18 acetylase RimI-like enzyme
MKPHIARLHQPVIIREARPGELDQVGEIRVAAYQAGGHMSADSGYAPVLRALGAEGDGTVLVAVDEEDGDRILGTVMLQPWPKAGQIVTGPGQAEIRALAVTPAGQGRGTGSALLKAVIELSAERGIRHLALLTQPDMLAAQHMYLREGFRRRPDQDWSPYPGVMLQAYGMTLPGPVPG